MITYILIQTQNLKKNQGTMEREIFPWRVFETDYRRNTHLFQILSREHQHQRNCMINQS